MRHQGEGHLKLVDLSVHMQHPHRNERALEGCLRDEERNKKQKQTNEHLTLIPLCVLLCPF